MVVEWVPRSGLVADTSWLGPAEVDRMRRQPEPLGAAWAAARCWVRQRLAARGGGSPADVEVVLSASHRPRFRHPLLPDDLDVNVAHTGSVLVVALSHGGVGVDVEELPPPREDLLALAEVVATPGELDELRDLDAAIRPAAFQRWWVRKEAVLKAQGTGFLADPRAVHVGVTVLAPPAPWVVYDMGLLPGPGRPALAVAAAARGTGDRRREVSVSRRPLGSPVST